ncbi:hypothetical protein TREES_T100007586 [Tupaia chinensis]|uniref:Uncharacterized protein n=1 Tax=Tupaia chinensis TaxID=246437 RepID=L9KVZ6_TUPCH|nr:hypothetical protein TREES_T100007586 [Tupaia chinensis]
MSPGRVLVDLNGTPRRRPTEVQSASVCRAGEEAGSLVQGPCPELRGVRVASEWTGGHGLSSSTGLRAPDPPASGGRSRGSQSPQDMRCGGSPEVPHLDLALPESVVLALPTVQ